MEIKNHSNYWNRMKRNGMETDREQMHANEEDGIRKKQKLGYRMTDKNPLIFIE